MYRAKERGKGPLSRCSTTRMRAEVRRAARARERAARAPIERGELEAALPARGRPRRPARSSAPRRWCAGTHPTRGLSPPAQFIPLAEETGLIVAARRAGCCARRAARPPRGTRAPRRAQLMRVNLSARQLDHPDLVAEVAGVARRHRPARRALLPGDHRDGAHGRRRGDRACSPTLHGARRARWRSTTSAPGTRRCSYLKRFPVDVLKIDRSFVDGLAAATPRTWPSSPTIIRLAEALGTGRHAEGIETREQAEALRAGLRPGPGLPVRPAGADRAVPGEPVRALTFPWGPPLRWVGCL